MSESTRKLLRHLLARIDPALAALEPEQLNQLVAQTDQPAGRRTERPALRWQDKIIEAEIPDGASVLDLGCGEGLLLRRLIEHKKVRGQGIELNADAVFRCVRRGVPVFQTDLDEGLKEFPSASYDYVVMEETLQTLHQPMAVLTEMLRVGRRGIVSFPNFAHFRVRLDFALRGRMPVTDWLPYHWYDTPNIHLFSLDDFLTWAGSAHVRIVASHVLADGQVRKLDASNDNLMAEEALLIVERG